MALDTRTHDHGIALYGAARAELLLRCERAVRRARRRGRGVVAALTVRVDPAVDPSAVVFASRQVGDDWFCFEQPDRDGGALAALGAVARLDAGADRFGSVAEAWRRRRATPSPTRPTGRPAPGSSPPAGSRSRPPARTRRTGPASGRAGSSCPRSRWRGVGATCG